MFERNLHIRRYHVSKEVEIEQLSSYLFLIYKPRYRYIESIFLARFEENSSLIIPTNNNNNSRSSQHAFIIVNFFHFSTCDSTKYIIYMWQNWKGNDDGKSSDTCGDESSRRSEHFSTEIRNSFQCSKEEEKEETTKEKVHGLDYLRHDYLFPFLVQIPDKFFGNCLMLISERSSMM